MREVVNFCDFYVICSGNSDRQVKAIADNIEGELKNRGTKVEQRRGMKDSDWVIFDSGDVITHIFEKRAREFYNLEYLWREAKRVDIVIDA